MYPATEGNKETKMRIKKKKLWALLWPVVSN